MAKKRYTEEELNRPLEPKGILSKAKSIGSSRLAYAGNLLGTPGAVVKNALGGANPLTPLLHPLSGEGRVEGRDLLRQHGLIGNKNTWGNWAGGLAVDIALDPLTYASPLGAMTKLGALTKAGRAAHAIGALDDVTNAATAIGRSAGTLGAKQVMGRAAARARTSLDDLLNFGDEATKTSRRAALAEYAAKNNLRVNDLLGEKLGGVMNIGLPGTHGYTIGASEAGAKFMEGLGGAAAAIPGAGLAGKVAGGAKHIVKGLFHGPSGGRIFTPTGKLDRYGQELSEKAHKYMGPAKHATVRQSLDLWDQFKAVDEEFHKAYRPEEAIAAGSKKYPLANGDLVQAGDRGNYGYVMSVADDGAEVHFTNPKTGATATVKMPYEQLQRASSTDLPESLRAMHDPVSRVLDRMVHMTGETRGNVDAAIEKFAKGQNIPPALRESIQKLAADAIEAKDAVWKTRIEMGGKGGMLDKGEEMLPPAEPAQPPPPSLPSPGNSPLGFQHSPRYNTPRGTGEPLKEFRQTPTGHASAGGRVPILRGLRKDQANDLGKLEKYRTPDAAKHILEDMGDNLGYKNAEGIDVSKAEHAQELAEYAARLPKDWVEKGKNIFDNMSFQDLGHYLLSAHKGNASLKALHESFMMNLGEEGVPLQEAFKFAGMDQNRALVYASQHYGLSPEQLLKARIPPELANAARSVIMTYENAEWSNLITKTLDTVNRYFKPAMVLVKPAFWFRNHTSGQYANLVSGYIENPGDFGKYWSAYKEAHDLWKSGDKAFERELQVLGVLGIDSTLEAHQHILKGTTQGPHAPLPPNPLRVGETSKEVWQGMSANPMPGQPVLDLLAKGTSGIRHKASTWMETNAKFNKLVEYQNRASLYLYLKRKGFTPEQASKIVTEVHYDYSSGAMAPFERDVMRRIVPFYVFSRNNLPWTVERLLTSPGGTMGQTIQALGRAHKTEDLSPEYLSETASVPLKTLPDGSRRYLTGLGLGFEDPAGFFTPSVKQVGLEALSRTSPLIKAPLEYAFGQSAFQKGPYGGRSLEDLNPPLGQTISNIGQLAGLRDKQGPVKLPGGELFEHVLSNSPLAGVLTSARTLTDPRKNAAAKAINLLSGLHVTDVSPASQDAELLRRAGRVERQLLGARSYSGTFVPKDRQAEFTPKEQEMAAELKALRRLLEERKKQRK